MARQFGDVVKPVVQYDFISGDDLAQYDRFTILRARNMPSRLNPRGQIFFDIAIKNEDETVSRYCFTADANAERQAVADAVKNGPLAGCRLDIVPTNGGNRYFKFADANTERPNFDPSETKAANDVDDDDIPF